MARWLDSADALGELHNQKISLFVLYIKISNTFFSRPIGLYVIHQNSQNVAGLANFNSNAIFEFLGQ